MTDVSSSFLMIFPHSTLSLLSSLQHHSFILLSLEILEHLMFYMSCQGNNFQFGLSRMPLLFVIFCLSILNHFGSGPFLLSVFAILIIFHESRMLSSLSINWSTYISLLDFMDVIELRYSESLSILFFIVKFLPCH